MSSSTPPTTGGGGQRVKPVKKPKKARYRPERQGRIKPVALSHPPRIYSPNENVNENEGEVESESVPEVSGDDNVTKHISQDDMALDHAADDQSLPRKRPRITLKLSAPQLSSSPPDELASEDLGEQTINDQQAPAAAVSQDAPLSSKEQSIHALTPVYDHYLGSREIDAGSLVNTKKFILNRTCPQWMLSYPSSPAVQASQSAQLNRALALPSTSPILPGIASFPDPFSRLATPSSAGQSSAIDHLRPHALLNRPAAVAGPPFRQKPATRPKLPKPSVPSHFLIYKIRQSHDHLRSLVPSRRPAQALTTSQRPDKARRIRSTLFNDDKEEAEASDTPVQAVSIRSSKPAASADNTQLNRPQVTPQNTGDLAAPAYHSSQASNPTDPSTSSGTGLETDRPASGYMHIPEGWTTKSVMAAESYREKHGKYPIEFARALKRPKVHKASNRNAAVSGHNAAFAQAQPGSSENPIDLG